MHAQRAAALAPPAFFFLPGPPVAGQWHRGWFRHAGQAPPRCTAGARRRVHGRRSKRCTHGMQTPPASMAMEQRWARRCAWAGGGGRGGCGGWCTWAPPLGSSRAGRSARGSWTGPCKKVGRPWDQRARARRLFACQALCVRRAPAGPPRGEQARGCRWRRGRGLSRRVKGAVEMRVARGRRRKDGRLRPVESSGRGLVASHSSSSAAPRRPVAGAERECRPAAAWGGAAVEIRVAPGRRCKDGRLRPVRALAEG